jgi:integrase
VETCRETSAVRETEWPRQRLVVDDGSAFGESGYQTLAAVLNSTVLDDVLARSPCRGIQLPEIEPVDRPVLSPDELLDLAEALGPEYEGMAFLGAVLGLRWGECAGLKVGRIDFERQTISVAQQVTRGAGGRSVLGPPKSAAGRRTLALPAALMEILREHLDRRDLTIQDADAFVFRSSSGEHLDYSNWLHRIWYPAREQAALEWLQFHDLRRANATVSSSKTSTSRRPKRASDIPTHDSPWPSTPKPLPKLTGQPPSALANGS